MSTSERKKRNVLFIGKSKTSYPTVKKVLGERNVVVHNVFDAESALELLEENECDVLIARDSFLLNGDPDFISQVKKSFPTVEIICLAPTSEPERANEAVIKGAYDILFEPINPGQLAILFMKAVEHRDLLHTVKTGEMAVKKNTILSKVKELKKLVEEIELVKQQVEDLQEENARLQQEKEILKNNFESALDAIIEITQALVENDND